MRPFTGKSGRELNENYLLLAGLTRDEVYMTNTCKCWHPKNQTPGAPLIEACSRSFLPYELDAVRPNFIVPMGGTACSLFDDIYLSTHHGMPLKRELWGKKYWVVPQYHPALGLHDPRKMSPMLEDWARLNRIISGSWRIKSAQSRVTDYRIARGRREVEDYLKPAEGFPVYLLWGGLDTETDADRLWCITVSVRPGTGIMIMADDDDAIAAFRDLADHYHWFIHNALFDLDKLWEGRGIHLKHVTCTMQGAYHRGNLPQGLKPLAWRELGIEMTDYEDVVVPFSKAKLMDWWLEAMMALEKDRITTERFSAKTGKPLKSVIKPSKLFSRMVFIYNHGMKGALTYNMWKKYDELEDAARERIEGEVGKPPRPSIIHVPIAKASHYACLEAKSLIRTEDGLRHIRDLVQNKYSGKVYSFNESTGNIELKQVTGWYRVTLPFPRKIKWLEVYTARTKQSGRWNLTGTRYTEDHRLLTDKGWVEAGNLRPGDRLAYPVSKLTYQQNQVVIGGVLGDSCLSVRNKYNGMACMMFGHTKRQWGYMDWKCGLLGQLMSSHGKPQLPKTNKNGSVLIKTSESRMASTIHHPQLLDYNESTYTNKIGPKHIGAWLEDLDVLGLAIWYQDDGCIIRYNAEEGVPRLYTNSFSFCDLEKLCGFLADRFGLECGLTEMRANQWAVSMNLRSATTFYEMIAPFVYPDLDYKLPPRFRGRFGTTTVATECPELLYYPVTAVREWKPGIKRGSYRTSFCVDVEGNHNFLTLNEVAHNCLDADAELQLGIHLRSQECRIRRSMSTVLT